MPADEPHERAGDCRRHQDRRLRAAVSEQRKRRRHERGHARRVNGVDLPVGAAPDEVRRQRASEVLGVVAIAVVVLDPQIEVAQQALRDDEVVGLVAARRP
jgi:hypothetical protein